jgi:hypothetical protein
MSARARRLALAFGSFARKGLIGRRGAFAPPAAPGGVARAPNGVSPGPAPGGVAPAPGRTNGIAGRAGDGTREPGAAPARPAVPPGPGVVCDVSTRPSSAAAVAGPRFGDAGSAAGLATGGASGRIGWWGTGCPGPGDAAPPAGGADGIGRFGGTDAELAGAPLPNGVPVRGGAGDWGVDGANSSRTDAAGVTVIRPPHTAQRARTSADGNLLGSTRKTDRHSGQVTFTSPPVSAIAAAQVQRRAPRGARRRPADSADDPPSTPTQVASSRSSSSQSPAR